MVDKALENLLIQYQKTFDIERRCCIGGEQYSAYGRFCAYNSKYVVDKSAKLWEADCYEHIFFMSFKKNTPPDNIAENILNSINKHIEPELIRHGKKYPPANHMYTYLTFVILSESRISPSVEQGLKRLKLYKSYMLSIKGYCQLRILAADFSRQYVFSNRAARPLKKYYARELFGK